MQKIWALEMGCRYKKSVFCSAHFLSHDLKGKYKKVKKRRQKVAWGQDSTVYRTNKEASVTLGGVMCSHGVLQASLYLILT